MDPAELTLHFSGKADVNVRFKGADSGPLKFTSPVTEKDRADIRWYVETYGAHSLGDPDDEDAKRIEKRLPEIGEELFEAVFGDRKVQRVFNRFQDDQSKQRVLTIDSRDAGILALPWELLRDPDGAYLFREKPHISVRRRISGAIGGREPFEVETKDSVHLLFVVSRPKDAGFIDPRTDPEAVLDALEQQAPGRVTYEFLRPATLNALHERLDDDTKPGIDILHFDGHGVFWDLTEEEAKKKSKLFGTSTVSEIQKERESRGKGESDNNERVGIGFLLFEKEDRTKHLIPAQDLADNLFQSKVGLVVLSACQTASLDTEGDPMASVAGRLTSTGIPAILAMTHSVLVATTEKLFGKFYESLAKGRGIATALDDARAYLDNNPEKYEVLRDKKRQMLKLDDWFLPALFHGGADTPLLTREADSSADRSADFSRRPPTAQKNNLRPRHEAGFFGRRRELWDIEYWFAGGETRRISITGFGGQGKTELALEAGRWLLRAGLFSQAVFIDYAGVQSQDARSVAVSTLSAVLEENFADADEVTAALERTPTLLILDNLETIPPESLQELLSAASAWSQAGDSRVLLTSRLPEFNHPDYRIEGTHKHRRLVLDGLGSAGAPDDALEWLAQLMLLPSATPPDIPPPDLARKRDRDQVTRLFDRVRFHPLSICVLAQQLKDRTAVQLEERLEQLLSTDAVSPLAAAAGEGTPDSLVASLELSLERLSPEERQAVGRLGVFQGGAFEDDLLAITELGEAEQSNEEREQLQALLTALESGGPRALLQMMGQEVAEGMEIPAEMAAQFEEQLRTQLATLAEPAAAQPSDNLWPNLRRQLEAAALIEGESIPGVTPPFLRFHPTLAPMLWAGLNEAQRDALTLAHRRRYYQLAKYLYHEDDKNPHQTRAIVRRELPNLLHAVHQALDAADADAVDFVGSVNLFLNHFGQTGEAAALTRRAGNLGGEPGSEAWYLAQSGRGEQLLDAGQAAEAAEIFTTIRDTLGETPSYNLAVTLAHLGRSYMVGRRPDRAEANYRHGIAVTEQLEPGDYVKRLRAGLRSDLATVLRHQGKFAATREQYELSLEIMRELNDLRSEGVVLGQLGTLALHEGDLADAVKRFQEALELFQRLGEPASEAVVQHQLGRVFEEAQQWEPAEQHYRESARLKEAQGLFGGGNGVATTWNQLAMVSKSAGKPEAAETWYRKAIDGMQNPPSGDRGAGCLNNLADLLQTQPGRLDEARQLAEEALAIDKTLDPGAAQIWKTYNLLAEIADKQSRPEHAADFRRQAREAKRNYAGTAHEMKQHAELIFAVVTVCSGNDEHRELVGAHSEGMRKGGGEWSACADAIENILMGERNEEILCAQLGSQSSPVIETILQALEDPSTLQALLPEDDAEE